MAPVASRAVTVNVTALPATLVVGETDTLKCVANGVVEVGPIRSATTLYAMGLPRPVTRS